MAAVVKKLVTGTFLLYFLLLTGCAGTSPGTQYSSSDNASKQEIKELKNQLEAQGKQIREIEKELIQYKHELEDQTQVIDVYDENNDSVREFKQKLENEVRAIISEMENQNMDADVVKTLNKIQNKIEILEDRTFYTDSLYFEIVNDLVMIENKITSLIASYKEMTEITGKKKTKVIPKITNEEYTAKYIESLSQYQNGEWNMSLDGFKFLIQADSNHDLADNCQYWIGEIYYALKDFRRAIKEFEKVFTFPGTNKADDAQFKLGLCYVNIGETDKAKSEFESLLEFYPNSEYYKKAQKNLQKY